MDSELVSVAHTGAEIPIGMRRLEKLPPYVKSLTTPDGGAVIAQFSGSAFDALVIVNRSPVREMQLNIALAPSVVRILEDGSSVSATVYGGAYSVLPGAAEIFVMRH